MPCLDGICQSPCFGRKPASTSQNLEVDRTVKHRSKKGPLCLMMQDLFQFCCNTNPAHGYRNDWTDASALFCCIKSLLVVSTIVIPCTTHNTAQAAKPSDLAPSLGSSRRRDGLSMRVRYCRMSSVSQYRRWHMLCSSCAWTPGAEAITNGTPEQQQADVTMKPDGPLLAA